MAETKKKKSFEEWYEETYGGGETSDEKEQETVLPDIAPPTQGGTNVFSGKKTNPIGSVDIAPGANGLEQLLNQQKAAKQENQKGFFNKGNAFSDGWKFGDGIKTKAATAADAIIGAAEGAGGLLEGVTDWLAYGVAQAGEKIDPDAEWHKMLKEGAMQNTLGDASGVRELVGIDDYSLLGNRTRGVLQGLGQVVTQIAAGQLGGQVASTVLTYLSAAGSGMGEAYLDGATDQEAALYGMVSGAVNAASEYLSKGLGKAAEAAGIGKGLGIEDGLANWIVKKIAYPLLRNGIQYTIKAGGEGLEEVIAGGAEAIAKKLIYEDEKTLRELLKDEKLLDQFVMGALVSGVAQGGDLVSSVQSGTDMITGESIEDIKNAQNVVNTLAEEQIAASEKDGKKLTAKQKADIKKDIEQALERGELNTEDIERIVGGEDYTKYKAEMERQEKLQKEEKEILDSLRSPDNKLVVTKDSIEKQKRLEELRTMKSNQNMVDALKSSLDERIAKATSSGRLAESYENRARRGQAFKADLSKYKGKALETVKKAVESGVLNDTRRTHELVDLVAKIAEDKGIDIDFTNNQRLAESGFAINGKQVNGFINANGITLNANSAKALNMVVGHEITHAFEGTELYESLSKAVTEYSKSKGEYDSRLKELNEIYKDVKDADVQKELVADLVGDYIFADEAFVRSLHAGDRNLFQKIFDEVKYLCKVATAGSEQEKQLLQVKRVFEKVYREGEAKPVPASEETKLSLARNDELMTAAEKYNDSHFGIDLEQARAQRQAIYDYMTKNAKKLVLPPDVEGDTAFKNSSYDISEENTSVCIRSLAADALCDAVAENLGRPLTVQETLQVSQDLMNYTDEPECVYCYVATDRRAYREFLGSYHKQMTSTIDALKSGKNSEDVYKAFLDGRKDTKNMRSRFAMWEKVAKGGEMISTADLASEKRMQEAMLNPALAPQVKDARAYAQSASWAKKRVGYTAYNGHILKWSQKRINDLNRHYGLRFYSFSDFSPAFILENMQQITDASVRGLKGLAYTKVLDFVEIFAPTGININISVFGYDQNGTVAQDGMMGANWQGAQDLRAKYENVGITFVATNDAQIEWALNQDWIDVVIPYHLVRTGQAVAKHFGYTNYTAESADTKGENWKKGDKKSIYPSEHNNDKQTYLDAIAAANLEPRFARWVNHPNYMKLVNETRRAASNTPAMRPVFNVEAAEKSLERMAQRGGYFVPIGGDYDNMQDIAGEIADNIRANTKFSVSPEADKTYLDAVASNDTITLQKMVDDAAASAGYQRLFFHGTPNGDFTKFKGGNPMWITESRDYAETYAKNKSYNEDDERVMELYAKMDNILDITKIDTAAPLYNGKYASKELVNLAKAIGVDTSVLSRMAGGTPYTHVWELVNTKKFADLARKQGYDTIKENEFGNITYGVLDPTQLKSAELVTRKHGKVITLSERFNTGKKDIRYSLSNPETDKTYLDAVARGDTETAQRMVDEAAKAAGYTVKAYHGTKAFGFTKIDVSKSDDGISFFATDSVDTAGTYSVDKRVKRIADAGEYVPDEKIEEMEEEGYDAMVDVAEFCNAQLGIRGWTDEERLHKRLEELFLNAENEAIDSEQVTEKIYEIFDDLYSEFAWAYHDNWYENSNLDEDEYMSYEEWEDSYEADQLSDKFYSYVDKIHSVATALLSVNGGLGIYSLYINTDNNLVVDCHGSKWDKISSKDLPDIKSAENQKYGYRSNREYWTTRIVAKYAKDNGYGGVTFKNVVDTNDGSGWAATVYISFDPQAQVKSADPVTYDDNGNVIPLSERFKSDNNDIRFSLSPETSQGVDRIALENIAPTREQIAEMKRVTTPAKKVDALPMRKDIAPKPKVKMQPSQQVVTTGSNIAPPVIGKERSFAKTAIKSDAVDEKVSFADLSQESTHYVPVTNAVTLTKADDKLVRLGYDKAVKHVNAQINTKKVSLEDIALGERLIQEAVRRGDTKTAAELIQNVAILGTELGQKVQALSIIKRLTPAGQLRMLEKVVERGKARGDKAFEGVELTQEMKDEILKTYNEDGVSYDQDALNKAVEDVKQRLADKMKVTTMERLNAWRYLAMLGNPKTHIRNIVSNVAMLGTSSVKNAVAKSIEPFFSKDSRTKTWGKATQSVKTFADNTATEEKDNITGDGKYSESASIKDKRKLFRLGVLNKLYGLNNDLLSKEDWWFSKTTYKNSLAEFLTANGIKTADDIKNNPELVEKGKQYAMEQAQIATFRQYSYIASKIGEIERKNAATEIAIGAVLPFKKTPINIAKTALNYSPLGFAKTITYDAAQVKSKKMEASTLIDHLAQNLTGTSLVLLGYALAKAGFINGAGDDDKEGEYDYQLGKQAYSVNIGGSTYSLSWLSPTAMPLFIGANAFEILEEKQEWNGDVVVDTLAQTLDPLSEMSFLSSLDDVLSSYDSGVAKFAGIASSAAQSYVSQYIPTLVSQVASVTDDKKRTTKVASDSDFKFADQTINQLLYKIPGLRQTLEPSTDIWGKTIYQNDDIVGRAVETFIAPWSRKELIANEIDAEIKELYSISGDTGVIPSIPTNHFVHEKVKYEMSEEEYTEYKQVYGRTANILLERLFATSEYKNASAKQKTAWVKKVYDIAKDDAKENFLDGRED